MHTHPYRFLRSLLGFTLIGCLLASTPPVNAAHLPRVLRPVLTRTTLKGGCCDFRVEALSAYSVTIADPATGFSAIADHLFLVSSRTRGVELLWVYVNEQNAASVTAGLDSGATNWLLKDSDGNAFAAYAGVPRRHPGEALAHVNGLQADTDPSNEGWIYFRFTTGAEGPFTLYWSDCQPGCAARGQDNAYSPIADVVLMHAVVPAGPLPPH